MAETVRPLELLHEVARRHSCAVGIVSTGRGENRLRAARLEALEVRSIGETFWGRRELVARFQVGALNTGRELPIDEAAAALLESLGRAGWLDEDDGA